MKLKPILLDISKTGMYYTKPNGIKVKVGLYVYHPDYGVGKITNINKKEGYFNIPVWKIFDGEFNTKINVKCICAKYDMQLATAKQIEYFNRKK